MNYRYFTEDPLDGTDTLVYRANEGDRTIDYILINDPKDKWEWSCMEFSWFMRNLINDDNPMTEIAEDVFLQKRESVVAVHRNTYKDLIDELYSLVYDGCQGYSATRDDVESIVNRYLLKEH